MTLAISILLSLWLLGTLLAVSLCQLARRGDEEQARAEHLRRLTHPPLPRRVAVRRSGHAARTR